MDVEIDAERIQELIENYRSAETAQQRREIENRVLEATVWQVTSEESFASYNRDELEAIRSAVDTDDERVKMLLRRPFFDDF